ncbi:hypothetical protein C6P46_000637 [Rhodotorula mucilaginosa]|uniref:MFS transporter n=1 Tax=Rhodotorula mucilaginosa TaxID=5537 RepID=A0A9P6W7K1_RHOMI|nr:hypothetical protein C6P46_000637 [Rhodotorula mucilaginosa]
MQSILLRRRLKTHYSLLVPFPPLPFAYPPRRRRPEELRVRTGSPLPPVTPRESQVQDGVQMQEMDRPDGLARSMPEDEDDADPIARRDAIEEIQPSPDRSDTSVKPPTESSGPPPGEEVLICWSMLKRIWTTLILCQLVLFSGAASSMNAYAASKASRDLGVSQTLVNLDTALFLVGFGVAAPIAAPLSELAGRIMVYLVSLAAFALLEVGAASCVSIASRSSIRQVFSFGIISFFSGCFASPPLSNAAAGIGDLWSARERTVVFPVFAAFGLLGPCLEKTGPVIGGWIASSSVSYRWTDWVQSIWALGLLILVFTSLSETFPPMILGWKAAAIRARNQDSRYLSPLQAKHLRGSYSFIFAAYDLSLEQTPRQLGRLFLAIPIGLVVCTAILVPLAWVDYQRCIDRAGLRFATAPPEARLRAAMIGTWAIPAGLLWTAWTSDGRYSIFHPLGGQALFGFGFLTCFVSSYLYLIDSYGHAAASALSAVTFLRYLVSVRHDLSKSPSSLRPLTSPATRVQGGAVLFTPPMYRHLSEPFHFPFHLSKDKYKLIRIHFAAREWALTLLACLAAALSFVPWLFYFLGVRIRSWSRWTLH